MKIAFLVTSRADSGILEPLYLRKTYLGYNPVVMNTTSWCSHWGSTSQDQALSIGTVVEAATHWLHYRSVDKLVVLGDRFETVAASLAAYTLRIPIVHLEGGEYTTGSLDDGYRWCISDVATWHCAATKLAATRLRKRGMANVYHTGALG